MAPRRALYGPGLITPGAETGERGKATAAAIAGRGGAGVRAARLGGAAGRLVRGEDNER
jgi:hypothetical protein